MDASTLWWLLALVLMGVGLVGTVFPLLPGTPFFLFFGMLVGAWADGFSHVATSRWPSCLRWFCCRRYWTGWPVRWVPNAWARASKQ